MNFALFLGCNSFVFVFFLWVLFVADPDSKGVGGFLSRFFTERVPQGLSRALRATLGNRVHGCVAGCIDFAFNKPNCLLQVLYLVLVNGSFLVFLLDGREVARNDSLGSVLSEPLFAILNFAKIDDSPMTTEWEMEVDWVKHERQK